MPQKLTDAIEPVNCLYYGDGGTGKTTDLAAMAHLGPVVVFNAESGVKSRPLKALGIPVENIEVFPGPDEELTYDGMEAEWLRIREALNKDPEAYAGVGWDSVTEIYKALLDSIVKKSVKKAERKEQERDPHFIARDDYGIMTEQVRSLVRKFRDLPCHFAVSALMRREVDDDSSVTYQPAVSPALQNDLIGWMDMVCVTSVAQVGQEEEYRGLFRPHSKFRGKDRLGAMPKWLVSPTFDRVVGYVEEEIEVETDPVMEAARAAREAAGADEGTGSAASEKEKSKSKDKE